ncbi:MAG: DUF420 domain-containing protein [Halobacteria archaeon]|nr:DUF420 domain-containing protein [Halobacteria archaeon]
MSSSTSGITGKIDVSAASLPVVLGDLAFIFLFVAVGELSHGNCSPCYNPRTIGTFVQFGLGWLVVGTLVGGYRSGVDDSIMKTVGFTAVSWFFSDIGAQALRNTAVFHGGARLSFFVVSFIAGTVFLLTWRLTWWHGGRAVESFGAIARHRPRVATGALSVAGYFVVLGTFAGLFPYPSVTKQTANLMSHAIAVINTFAVTSLILGVYWVKKSRIQKHKKAMLTAFSLILIFLVVYLFKVGGAGEKYILVEGGIYYAYLVMLAVHLVLSVVAVPFVIHAVVLGISFPVEEIPDTSHPRVGKIAAGSWILSLVLGIITYLMLQYYGWHW